VSTCLSEIRLLTRGQIKRRKRKTRAAKGADLRLPAWDPRGFPMTCGPGRRASHPPLVEGLCFIWCGTRRGVSEDTSRGHCRRDLDECAEIV
jgi:hypothetical protein